MNKKSVIRIFEKAIRARDSGRLEDAVTILENLIEREPIEKEPKVLGTYFILGCIYMDLELYEKSSEAFRVLVRYKPYNEDASLGLFFSLFNLSLMKEAFEEMKRFITVAESEAKEYRKILSEDALARGIIKKNEKIEKNRLLELAENFAISLINYVPVDGADFPIKSVRRLLESKDVLRADK